MAGRMKPLRSHASTVSGPARLELGTDDAEAAAAPAGQDSLPWAAEGLTTWDCHVHVFGQPERYPLVADRRYTPGVADVGRLLAHARAAGIDRLVLVQPTPYGDDNRCLFDALAELGSAHRALAVLDPLARDDLQELHERGVRGLRINPPGAIQALSQVETAVPVAAARLSGTPWHIEVNCLPVLARPIAALCAGSGVPLVYDHLFGLDPSDPRFGSLAAEMIALAADVPIWVKLSGPDRVCVTREHYARWAEVALAVFEAASGRVVWGSDWPHTPVHGQDSAFRPVDELAQLSWLHRVLGAEALRSVLRDNPQRLYG
jgi:predicted TIM-barrel fold metal-dependent hydrolase